VLAEQLQIQLPLFEQQALQPGGPSLLPSAAAVPAAVSPAQSNFSGTGLRFDETNG
jgi:hypothetical protein